MVTLSIDGQLVNIEFYAMAQALSYAVNNGNCRNAKSLVFSVVDEPKENADAKPNKAKK